MGGKRGVFTRVDTLEVSLMNARYVRQIGLTSWMVPE